MRMPVLLLSMLALLTGSARAATPDPQDWDAVQAEARGQTVYFHAWAGDPQINGFIVWAGEQLEAQFGVTLQHVKIGDTAESVSRIVAERMAGNQEQGSADLLWVNGENFAALKASAQETWRLSDLTLPHAMVRVMVAEALYRAWSLMVNHPYHRE